MRLHQHWDDVLQREFAVNRGQVRVAMVGKYVDLQDAYKSLNEALGHAGLQTTTDVSIEYFDAEEIERDTGLQVLLFPKEREFFVGFRVNA